MEKQTRTIYVVTEAYIDHMGLLNNGNLEVFNTLLEAQEYLSKQYHENEQYLSEEMDSELDLDVGYAVMYFNDNSESSYEIDEREIIL